MGGIALLPWCSAGCLIAPSMRETVDDEAKDVAAGYVFDSLVNLRDIFFALSE